MAQQEPRHACCPALATGADSRRSREGRRKMGGLDRDDPVSACTVGIHTYTVADLYTLDIVHSCQMDATRVHA